MTRRMPNLSTWIDEYVGVDGSKIIFGGNVQAEGNFLDSEGNPIGETLPSMSGNAGKVLTVNAAETAAEWKTPSGGQLYLHQIIIGVGDSTNTKGIVNLILINESSAQITTAADLLSSLTNTFTPLSGCLYSEANSAEVTPIMLMKNNSSSYYIVFRVLSTNKYNEGLQTIKYSGTAGTNEYIQMSLTDYVVAL